MAAPGPGGGAAGIAAVISAQAAAEAALSSTPITRRELYAGRVIVIQDNAIAAGTTVVRQSNPIIQPFLIRGIILATENANMGHMFRIALCRASGAATTNLDDGIDIIDQPSFDQAGTQKRIRMVSTVLFLAPLDILVYEINSRIGVEMVNGDGAVPRAMQAAFLVDYNIERRAGS